MLLRDREQMAKPIDVAGKRLRLDDERQFIRQLTVDVGPQGLEAREANLRDNLTQSMHQHHPLYRRHPR